MVAYNDGDRKQQTNQLLSPFLLQQAHYFLHFHMINNSAITITFLYWQVLYFMEEHMQTKLAGYLLEHATPFCSINNHTK